MIGTAGYVDKRLDELWRISTKELVAGIERLGYAVSLRNEELRK
jgi:hypothetical protein